MADEEQWLAWLEAEDVERFNATRTERSRIELFAADLSGKKLTGVDLSNANLEKSDFTGSDLTDATLMKANFTGIDGSGAILRDALGLRCRFKDAWLDGADLAGADLAQADFAGANLERSTGAGVRFAQARLRGIKAAGASWPGADLSEAKLGAADLERADLSKADLTGAVVDEANLSGADLTGITAPAANFKGTKLVGARLTAARLPGANLSGVDLTGADLAAADLARANLAGAVLKGAILKGAVLADANLDGADLSGADLTDADLTGLDPTALGLDEAVAASLSGFGIHFDAEAELLPSDVSVARSGDAVAIVWENPEGEPQIVQPETTDPDAPPPEPVQPTVLRYGVVRKGAWRFGVVPVPGDSVLDRQVVAWQDGFRLVVTRSRPEGAALVVVPLAADGALGAARSVSLGYDPVVRPVLRVDGAKLRMFGLARRGPTLVVHDLTEAEPKLVRSDAVSTAAGFLPGQPVLACKGGVVMAVGPTGPQPPRRSPEGFPGPIATAFVLGDEIIAAWGVRRVGTTPGGMRLARIGRRHGPREEPLGRNAVIGAVAAIHEGERARLLWIDTGRDGAAETQLWQAVVETEGSPEPMPMECPEDVAELRVAPGVAALLGADGRLVLVDPADGRGLGVLETGTRSGGVQGG